MFDLDRDICFDDLCVHRSSPVLFCSNHCLRLNHCSWKVKFDFLVQINYLKIVVDSFSKFDFSIVAGNEFLWWFLCLMSSLFLKKENIQNQCFALKRSLQNTMKGMTEIGITLCNFFLFCKKRRICFPPPPFALKTLAITLRARLPLVELYCRVATDCVRRRGGLSRCTWWWWWWWT